MPVERRTLTDQELALVHHIASREAPQYDAQTDQLTVVGRCGCGACPTIFFKQPNTKDRESDVGTYAGRDSADGLTGVVLLQSAGELSQLEFYSVDGHDPWNIPSIETLERI